MVAVLINLAERKAIELSDLEQSEYGVGDFNHIVEIYVDNRHEPKQVALFDKLAKVGLLRRAEMKHHALL